MRPSILAVGLLFCAWTAWAGNVTSESCGNGCTRWKISRPVTTPDGRPERQAEVRVTTQDIITIAAGGCITAPSPEQPRVPFAQYRDSNSVQLGGGFVFVPGVTSGLVPIARMTDNEWVVSRAVESISDSAVAFAFAVGDNRGGLPQCRPGSPEQYAIVTIRKGAAPPTPKAFDLAFDRYDENGFALNPFFEGQVHPKPGPLKAISPKLCRYFQLDKKGMVDTSVCTRQRPYFDRYPRWDGAFRPCPLNLKNRLHGHVNWAPVSVTGRLTFTELSDDGDLNFELVPDTGGLLTSENSGSLHVELAAYELQHLMTTEWKAFDQAVRARDFVGARKLLTGDLGTRAEVIGVLGLDSEHFSFAEIHPVYGLAAKRPGTADDWYILARNFGNEGDCSRFDHRQLRDELTISIAGHGQPVLNSTRTDRKVKTSRDRLMLAYQLRPPEEHAVADDFVSVTWTPSASDDAGPVTAIPSATIVTRDSTLGPGQRELLCSLPGSAKYELCRRLRREARAGKK